MFISMFFYRSVCRVKGASGKVSQVAGMSLGPARGYGGDSNFNGRWKSITLRLNERTFPVNFRDISDKIPGHVPEMFRKFPGNLSEMSWKFPWTFPGIVPEISRKVPRDFPECSRTFPGHFLEIPRNCPGHFQ